MKILFIAILSVTLVGCNMGHNQQVGSVGGAVVGGLLGNSVGKGSGRTASTIVGTYIGTVTGSAIGKSLDGRQNVASTHSSDRCTGYTNAGARSACNRGVAARLRMRQMQLERRAYSRGYGR